MSGKAIDYSITPISFYKFVCNDVEIKSTYVGHTVNFITRKSKHKHSCNTEKEQSHHFKLYQTIRDNGGWDNWRMIVIESRLVKDKREAERIEQEFMDKLQTDMNTRRSYYTEDPNNYQSKYYQEHKEEVAIKHKAYAKKHKEDLTIYKKAWNEKHKEDNAIYFKARYQRQKEQKLMSQEDKRY